MYFLFFLHQQASAKGDTGSRQVFICFLKFMFKNSSCSSVVHNNIKVVDLWCMDHSYVYLNVIQKYIL